MMKTLPTQFNAQGHHFVQFWRKNDVALYQRSLNQKAEPHELELVTIKVKPAQIMPNGTSVDEREAYPKPSDWGTLAWSIPTRYKVQALALADQCAGISEGRASFMRSNLHKLWSQCR